MSVSKTGDPDIGAGETGRLVCFRIKALESFSILDVKESSKEGFGG